MVGEMARHEATLLSWARAVPSSDVSTSGCSLVGMNTQHVEDLMSRSVWPFDVLLSSGRVFYWLPPLQDAMVVILKSLVPGCLFNIIGFGSTFKSVFMTSQNYEEVEQRHTHILYCIALLV